MHNIIILLYIRWKYEISFLDSGREFYDEVVDSILLLQENTILLYL